MSEFIDKMKELDALAEAEVVPESTVSGEEILREALEKAMFVLGEIEIYGAYGRADQCRSEATEVLTILRAAKFKYDEQQKIMDALTGGSMYDQQNA